METKAKKEEEVGSPVRGIFCLKIRKDMKKIEETEDCFILDFNPFDTFDIEKLTLSDDEDLAVIHETGQVACRDYPHPRHLCVNFPFGSTPKEKYCDMCYCYICDKPAPCELWISSLHCNASATTYNRECECEDEPGEFEIPYYYDSCDSDYYD